MLICDSRYLFQASALRTAWRADEYRHDNTFNHYTGFEVSRENVHLAHQAYNAEARAHVYITAIAQISCRPLCDLFHNSLPRELRDMVYVYLLDSLRDSRTVHVEGCSAGCTSLTLDPKRKDPMFCVPPHQCVEGSCASFFFGQAYVGEHVKAEIAEAWLRSTVFYFIEGWEWLSDLLCNSRMDMSRCLSEYISKIEIRIDEYLLATQCLENLECLGVLGPRTRVTLFLDFEETCEWGTQEVVKKFEAVLEILWQWISCLAESRLQIIVWCDDNDSDVLKHEGNTVEEWVTRLRAMI